MFIYLFVCVAIVLHLQVRQYFESLPGDKVPEINTPGERYREQQLSYQWPKQDLALNYCNHIESQNKASYEDFVAGRNEIALDIAYVKDINSGPVACINCDDDIEQGDLAVIAPKFKDDVSIHIQFNIHAYGFAQWILHKVKRMTWLADK